MHDPAQAGKVHAVQPGVMRDGDLGNVEVLLPEHGLFQQLDHFRALDQFVHPGTADLVGVDHLVGTGGKQLGRRLRGLAHGDDAQLRIQRAGRDGQKDVLGIFRKQAEHALDVAADPDVAQGIVVRVVDLPGEHAFLVRRFHQRRIAVQHDEGRAGHGQAPRHLDGERVAAEQGETGSHRDGFQKGRRCPRPSFNRNRLAWWPTTIRMSWACSVKSALGLK